MPPLISPNIPKPSSLAVRRERSMFYNDIESNIDALTEQIQGSRILVIGGAGSIGASTIDTVSMFCPKSLHIVDQNENGLAELVRALRSRTAGLNISDFQALPLNYGNPSFYHFLHQNAPYDIVLNFAALKHVRSEKDPFSIMEMLNTNLLLMAKLLAEFSTMQGPTRFFSVSTDKAANPSSMMGASKRLMEHFLFDQSLPRPANMTTTSARFANVAYSNGSLLKSFNSRLEAGQPLVAPKDCRRYFVSLEESGHICTLSAMLGDNNAILIPNLNPEDHLVLLEDVLFDYLNFKGYEPRVFEDETEARMSVDECRQSNKWPVLLPPLDTAGEKPYEEFCGAKESVMDVGLESLSAVNYLPPEIGNVANLQKELVSLVNSTSPAHRKGLDKEIFKRLISSLEPAFLNTHRESSSNLDQRM